MDESMLALGAADLADLLTVVERWAGIVPTDDQSTHDHPTGEEVTEPAGSSRQDIGESPVARRPRSVADIDVGRSSGEDGPRTDPPDAERGLRGASDASGSTAGPAERARPASTQGAADGRVPPNPGPTTDAASASPGLAPRIAPSAPIHWTGQLPSTRPARHRGERSPGADRETPAWGPRAARPATSAGVSWRPATAVAPGGEADPGNAARGDNDRVHAPSEPQVAPSAPVTLAFPSPVVAPRAGDAGRSAPTGTGAGSVVARSAQSHAAAPTATAANDRAASLPQRGPDTSLDDLIGRDRLAEAMADAIEAALLDAGVDLS